MQYFAPQYANVFNCLLRILGMLFVISIYKAIQAIYYELLINSRNKMCPDLYNTY